MSTTIIYDSTQIMLQDIIAWPVLNMAIVTLNCGTEGWLVLEGMLTELYSGWGGIPQLKRKVRRTFTIKERECCEYEDSELKWLGKGAGEVVGQGQEEIPACHQKERNGREWRLHNFQVSSAQWTEWKNKRNIHF